ncbi:molybdenum cofactor guanylyltransferase [Salinibacterium sp.]|uniref:molybdenum cofactor guanylyltransferase n=1 Tax=Salinibacterium sp. TaxID=1915057 RepID=UPI00286D224B|nr:molybdenum cofactor guanylyltransferase [Salinibacterium sp.]
MTFDAVVLAGGRSERLGGRPKAQLVFNGSTLLERTLKAVQDARQIVIVGDPGSSTVPITTIVTCEVPRFGGPVPALAGGLVAATGAVSEWVLLLACDMPHVVNAIPGLLSHRAGDGVLARDDDGRDQYLLACYRRAALLDAVDAHSGALAGMSMRALVGTLDTTVIDIPAGSARDVDTWDDAADFDILPNTGALHD